MGEENLGNGKAMGGETFLPHLHEARLTDCRAGLFLGDFLGFLSKPQRAHAEADRARGNDNHLCAAGAEIGDFGADGGDACSVEQPNARSEDTGAEFDDDTLR